MRKQCPQMSFDGQTIRYSDMIRVWIPKVVDNSPMPRIASAVQCSAIN